MRYQVTHRTNYTYDRPVESSYGQVHQFPIDGEGQSCLQRSVSVSPQPDQVRERTDFFGNQVFFYSIHQNHHELDVLSESLVDTSQRITDFGHTVAASQDWQTTLDALASSDHPDDVSASQFRLDSPRVAASDRLQEFAQDCLPPKSSLLDVTTRLAHVIFSEFEFSPEATDVSTPIDEVLEKRAGVCQDFAHLMIGALRSIGVAARYVSGYLETQPPPGQPKLAGADQSHAWVDVYLGGNLWMGVDPTNDQLISKRYVTTARGRDYSDITPLKGIVFTNATETEMLVSVDVIPMPESVS